MPNTLGVYNPIFYANEALIQLERSLGMAGRVYRGFDSERKAFGKGDTINIRKPSTFTTAAAPGSAQTIDTETVPMQLNNWREVRMNIPDDEFAYTGARIINDHIRPAAVALADYMDQQLAAEYANVPFIQAGSSSYVPADIVNARKVMFDNGVPLRDAANLHLMIGGNAESDFLSDPAFSQQQGAADTGVTTQITGTLGRKYGFEVFSNQNTPSHVGGGLADGVGAAVGPAVRLATTMAVDGLTVSATLKKGDTFSIAGHTHYRTGLPQRYALTADATTDGTGAGTVAFTPALVNAVADNDVVTFVTSSATDENLMFHRNAFAIAMAPLPDAASVITGTNVATISDPITQLSLRSRIYYDGATSSINVVLDVLFGVKTLDGNMACRLRV